MMTNNGRTEKELTMSLLDSLSENLTIANSDDCLASLQGAHTACRGGELGHDQPPDGQGEGQPDGHCVDHDGEVGVEQQEDPPG